jgi:hypothetical protein
VVKCLGETNHKKTRDKDKQRLRYLHAFLSDKYLDDIDYDLIELIANAKESDGAKPATVNRHLAVIRSVLRKARDEWRWVSHIPKVRMRQEPTKLGAVLVARRSGAIDGGITGLFGRHGKTCSGNGFPHE